MAQARFEDVVDREEGEEAAEGEEHTQAKGVVAKGEQGGGPDVALNPGDALADEVAVERGAAADADVAAVVGERITADDDAARLDPGLGLVAPEERLVEPEEVGRRDDEQGKGRGEPREGFVR